MNKKEALTLYMKVHDECLTHKCKDCAFREPFNGMGACIMDYVNNYAVGMSIKETLKRIYEKQEKSSDQPENIGKTTTKVDNVNRPKHYVKGGLECIQVIKAQLTPEQYEGYLYGNVIKYMWRWKEKNGLEDLRKAAHYLMWLQEEVTTHG